MKKRWMSGTLALLLAGTTVASMMPAVSVKAEGNTANGTTYYVDSQRGDDSNDGTAENKAFRTLGKVNELNLEPGDTVLLKKGSVFEDQALTFTKEDSGTAEAPVKISTYGEGDRPKINTNGHGQWELNYGTRLDNVNHKWKGTVSSSILIEDTEYIEIDGLELTNDRKSSTDAETGKAYNDAYAMDRTGVAGVAKDNGTVDHIVLNDLYIHDVTGNVYNKHMTNGGIYFIVAKPTNEGETGIARYNDVQIRNCSLNKVNRWGIAVGYTYQWRQFETAELPDAMMAKYGSSNVVIENNYLNHVGGDAITTMYLDRPMVQYNVSENAAEQINTTAYTQQQPRLDANGTEIGKQPVGAGRVAAGIWPWKCKNAIFQYNECFKTLNASKGNGDGQPWDADYGDGTNYQYNYSHGNTASTIMFCYDNSVNNTFRYNISQNEDMGPLDPAQNSGNCQVYNNTFYIKEGLTSIWSTAHSNNGPVNMENNIFYFAGDTPAKTGNSWNPHGNKTYSNNLYYNVETYPDDAAAVKVDAGTQVLVDAGSGPDSVAVDKAARKHENPTEKTVFDGYKLAENSPAINKGKVVVDRNGYTIDHDFFGHAITAVPEIGAAESDAVVALVLRSNVYTVSGTNVSDLPKNTTVEDFLKNVIIDAGVTLTIKDGEKELTATDIVKGGATITLSYEGMESVTYTVVASSDKELKDCYYEVKGTTMSVPYTDNNPATVKEVKANITVADTATVSVLNGENELADTNNVAAGMILRITAENGDRNDYIIAQKNTYNWTLDYVNGQQGNVWFGQIKDGSGDWANMTAVDKDGWPNWATHTYYGPGIDAPQGTITTTNPSVHGLLSAPPSTDISTAMAYRVPKSGTVTFNVKDDEPYLRQSTNDGGMVTLSLYVNGTEKKSVTLVNSKEKVGNWEKPEELEVAQGDIIRVVAKCNGNPSKPSAHITPIITYVDKAAADTKAPTAPEKVAVTDVTTTTAKVTWAASTDNVGVAGYNVYLNDPETPVNSETLVTDTEYSLTDLTAATNYSVTVTAVDAAGNASEGAVRTFTTKADKSALQTRVDEAKEIVTNTAAYTEESLNALRAAINAAQKVLDDPAAAQEEVNAQTDALNAAIAALVEKPVVDKTELQTAVADANEFAASDENKEKYTEDSWKTLEEAITVAQAVLNKPEATQEEVNDALKALKDAKENLKTKEPSVEKPGKAELEETVNDANAFVKGLENPEMYTEESLNALKEAIAMAEEVLASETATQDDINAAMRKVRTARGNLALKKPAVATEALENAIANARELAQDTATYTEESRAALNAAVDAAQKVLEDANATQETVDKQTEAVEAAIKALVKIKVPAETDKLKEAVKEAEELVKDTEKYSEESLKALRDAIALAQGVLEDTNATQAQVDEALKAVNDAKNGLVAKETDKKDDGKKDDGKKDDGKQDDGKKEDPKKDPTPTPGPATPTPTTTPTPSTTPQPGAKPAAPSGNTNTGSTNAGGTTTGSTTTGSTSTARAAKTGDTANAAAWLFTLAASAVAGTVIVKRKRED